VATYMTLREGLSRNGKIVPKKSIFKKILNPISEFYYYE